MSGVPTLGWFDGLKVQDFHRPAVNVCIRNVFKERDQLATLIDDLKFDREEALAQVEQWRRINEGREYVITSYRIGQPSYADKGETMIDEAREELLKILARRARKNLTQKESG